MNLLPATTLTTENAVHHADLFTLCNALPSQSVDMILCDLPYGTVDCAWDTVIPFAPMWKAFKRVIKPRGAIVLTASQPFTSALVMSNPSMFKHQWVWDKAQSGSFQLAKYQPLKITEDILVFGIGSVHYHPVMTRGKMRLKSGNKGSEVASGLKSNQSYLSNTYYPVNLIRFPNSANKSKNVHPTQKPVALFEYLIRTYTQEGELVLDPCVGSGTTAVAARNTKRRFICGDTSLDYVQIARDRLRLPFEQHHTPQDNDLSGLPLFTEVSA